MGERKGATAAASFVEKRNVFLLEDLGFLEGGHDKLHAASKLAFARNVAVKFANHRVLKNGAGKDVTGLTIAEKGNRHEENREFDLTVVLVAGLFNLHGHVSAFLVVAKGEDCTTGKKEVAKSERINVRADDWFSHSGVV